MGLGDSKRLKLAFLLVVLYTVLSTGYFVYKLKTLDSELSQAKKEIQRLQTVLGGFLEEFPFKERVKRFSLSFSGDLKVILFEHPACPKCVPTFSLKDFLSQFNTSGFTVLFEKHDLRDLPLYVEYLRRMGYRPLRNGSFALPLLIVTNGEEAVTLFENKEVTKENVYLVVRYFMAKRLVQEQKVEVQAKEEVKHTSQAPLLTSPALIVTTGILAGLNPCLYALLFIIAAFMMIVVKEAKPLFIGITRRTGFICVGVFIAFSLFGLLMLSIPGEVLQRWKIAAAGVIGFFALWHLAYFVLAYLSSTFRSKGLLKAFMVLEKSFEKPVSVVKFTRAMIVKGNPLTDIFLGFIFSLVKLPCLSGIYIALLFLLSKEGLPALAYILLFNFSMTMPVFFGGLAISALTLKGVLTAEKLMTVRRGRGWLSFAALSRLAIGLTLLATIPFILH